ncbi:DNA-binding protein [Salidesulfovibrio onnuriiensis]|uniref:DNA-binding protein n=1 Tax=Salidesulfovibrio onnuriiensis TaxID=2583823 RepID=UPI0011C84E4D|nr:DNA-binding protein [Salidesulfovibrio onnuriiensis]
MQQHICLKGAKDICYAVGENPKEITSLVKLHGLPAWKRANRGQWRALPEDLRRWVRAQRDKNIGRYLYGEIS